MGQLLKILLALVYTGVFSSVDGHFYSGQNPNPFYHQSRFGIPVIYEHKVRHQVPAFIPVSPTFQVEIMKPMAQLEEQKTVTLFIIPQNSLHVYPNVQKIPLTFHAPLKQYPELTQLMGDPTHLPAIEIPLQNPLVVGTVESKVLAPAGFTVLFKGPFGSSLPFPIHTGALLAPVPAGTIISAESPVVLNTIYAVPSLPSLPSYYPLYVDLPTKIVAPSSGTTIAAVSPSTQKVTTALIPVTQDNYPSDPSSPGFGDYPSTVITPPTNFQQDISFDNEVPVQDIIEIPPSGLIAGSGTQSQSDRDRQPFSNSKESPYLQELREQSIRTIQAEITALQRRLAEIKNN